MELVILHVHDFCLMLDAGFISNTKFVGVIELGGRFGLSTTHLDKGLTNFGHGFGTDEEARNFGFVSRGHEKLDDLGNSKYRDISGRDRDRSVFGEHDVCGHQIGCRSF